MTFYVHIKPRDCFPYEEGDHFTANSRWFEWFSRENTNTATHYICDLKEHERVGRLIRIPPHREINEYLREIGVTKTKVEEQISKNYAI